MMMLVSYDIFCEIFLAAMLNLSMTLLPQSLETTCAESNGGLIHTHPNDLTFIQHTWVFVFLSNTLVRVKPSIDRF